MKGESLVFILIGIFLVGLSIFFGEIDTWARFAYFSVGLGCVVIAIFFFKHSNRKTPKKKINGE